MISYATTAADGYVLPPVDADRPEQLESFFLWVFANLRREAVEVLQAAQNAERHAVTMGANPDYCRERCRLFSADCIDRLERLAEGVLHWYRHRSDLCPATFGPLGFAALVSDLRAKAVAQREVSA